MNTRKPSSQASGPSEGVGPHKIQLLQVSHVRRCHHCQNVSFATGSALLTCQSCGRHLAPFYFFDESSLDGLDEGGLHKSVLPQTTTIQPIWGISFYWTDEVLSGETKEELQIKDLHESHLRRHKKSSKKQSRRNSGHRD